LTDGFKVLIVEDEPAVRRLFQRILSEGGYQVQVSGTGRHARLLLRDSTFDLVLADMSLPDVDGPDLIRDIVADYPFVRILACSGTMLGSMRELALGAGAAAVFEKPITARKLLEAVSRVIDPTCSWVSRSC
jgi:CheY-like chemotaxis protein